LENEFALAGFFQLRKRSRFHELGPQTVPTGLEAGTLRVVENILVVFEGPGFNVKVQHLDGKLPKELVCAHEKRVSAFGSRGT